MWAVWCALVALAVVDALPLARHEHDVQVLLEEDGASGPILHEHGRSGFELEMPPHRTSYHHLRQHNKHTHSVQQPRPTAEERPRFGPQQAPEQEATQAVDTSFEVAHKVDDQEDDEAGMVENARRQARTTAKTFDNASTAPVPKRIEGDGLFAASSGSGLDRDWVEAISAAGIMDLNHEAQGDGDMAEEKEHDFSSEQ
eukprot:c3636_g1_i1.p1 GENE.c3636_g1_i1~~c3636_g1_i1.p1  ORF type:complete len:199 (-),score=25.56 c3636_g1_i1:405-1001(-)